MILVILLLAMWPFHHKKPLGTVEGGMVPKITSGDVVVGPRCEKAGNLYFYADEGIIGFSPVSCDGAYYNWQITHVDPVKMDRS